MKVSKQERLNTRRKLLTAAVDVITEKGFTAATMREIARRGGVSDATIYNYFPTKEQMLVAYFEEKQFDAIELLKGIEDFETYTLQEQLQTLFETKLELFLGDREFVAIAFERAFHTPAASRAEIAHGRSMFVACVRDMLDAAIEAGEIPEQPYQGLAPELITDLYMGLLYYWIRDDSEGFTRTTQLIDKSLDLVVSLLSSGIVAKALDIVSFLFRQHLGNYLDAIADHRDRPIAKRGFMAGFERDPL